MSQATTRFTNVLLCISATGVALLMCWAAISGADVVIFHGLYISLIVLLALMCTSTNMHSGLVIISLSLVLVPLWVFVNASYGQPVLYASDLNTELRIVQDLLLGGHLPKLIGGAKSTYYATYPGLELVTTSLDLVSGVAAIDFLGYGAAILSGITVWLVFAFYRRLLPQRSLATTATVVATFSCWMITYGSLVIHQTLALIFVLLALLGLSLPRKSSLAGVILFYLAGLAIVISHILTGFMFMILIGAYVVCSWILTRRLDNNRRIMQIRPRHLLFFAAICVAWNVLISANSIIVGQNVILEVLSSSWSEYVTTAAIPKGTKPAWVVELIVLGFVLYGLVTLVGMFAAIRSRLSNLAKLIPFGLSGGAIFLILFSLPIGGLIWGPGLQARGFVFAYLFGAPLFVIGLNFVLTRKPRALRYRNLRARILALLILAVVLSPAVYYGVNSFLYDRTSGIASLDIRLGYAAEYGAYVFASRHSGTPDVYAVDIAANMGRDPGTGISIKPFTFVVPANYNSVRDLVQGQCRTMIMRQSITRVPDGVYTVSTSDYQYLLVVSNIVYSSGDPLVLYVTYCAISS